MSQNALRSSNLRSGSQYMSSSDYYDYGNYGLSMNQNIRRLGSAVKQPKLGRLGAGAGGLFGGFSNTYGTYAGAGAGYGDYDYSSGYSSAYSPAQSKSTYGSYSGGYNDCPGIPIALLLVTLLGIGVMGFILFTKIQAAGRRKRSALDVFEEIFTELESLDRIIFYGRMIYHYTLPSQACHHPESIYC